MEIQIEIYTDIIGYEGLYRISNYGNIYSFISNKVLKPSNVKGYNCIQLTNGNKKWNHRICRLVAKHFCDDFNDCLVVNHIDGNKKNDYIENIEMVTQKENINHAFRTGLAKNMNKNYKPIICFNTNTVYRGISDFAKANGIHPSTVSHILRNGSKKYNIMLVP